MDFILGRRLKFYTKESFKVLKFISLGLAFILALIFFKYKPAYEVNVSGQDVGFVLSKSNFENMINEYIENYSSKNVSSVSISNSPEYNLKLVDKKQETNETDILIALQKNMIINYQYFDIYMNNEKVDSVDTLFEAQMIVNNVNEIDSNLQLEIKEINTQNVDEINTTEFEIAKNNILNKANLVEEQMQKENLENSLPDVNGIKLAMVPVQGNITSRYGVNSRIRVSTHTGLDIAAVVGTPIKVAASGTVTCASYTGSYGNLVKIDHGNGVETWYGHTSKMYVKVGKTVQAGDVIAAVGSTGNSTGPHLHFEIRVNGQHVNPQNYMYSSESK